MTTYTELMDKAADKRAEAISAAKAASLAITGPAADRIKERLAPFEAAILAAHDARDAEKVAAHAEYLATTKGVIYQRDQDIALARRIYAKEAASAQVHK